MLWIPVLRLFPSWASAQCWGVIILHTRHPDEEMIKHEDRHSTQWLWLGPFFLPAYGLASVWSRLKHGNWYLDNWFEQDARAEAAWES